MKKIKEDPIKLQVCFIYIALIAILTLILLKSLSCLNIGFIGNYNYCFWQ